MTTFSHSTGPAPGHWSSRAELLIVSDPCTMVGKERDISPCGWRSVIVEDDVHVFGVRTGGFVPASLADNSGTGPYHPYLQRDVQILAE